MSKSLEILAMVLPLLVAVILHEISHGYVALKLGDPTAKSKGRITLNPFKHIDPFMTIAVPAMLIIAKSPVIFGGAKPVPVDPRYFKNPKRDMALVAVAGPITNFILAGISFLLFELMTIGLTDSSQLDITNLFFIKLFAYSVIINLILAVFNLVPIPPLDGGRIAVGILPIKYARALMRLEPFGLIIVVVLLLSGVLDFILVPVIEYSFKILSL